MIPFQKSQSAVWLVLQTKSNIALSGKRTETNPKKKESLLLIVSIYKAVIQP